MSHAIELVGWDDSISKDLFRPRAASRDGAWIMKNSWCLDGFEGYFYISYDTKLREVIGYDYGKKQDYQNLYFYDAEIRSWIIDDREPGYNEAIAVFPVKKANEKGIWIFKSC